MPGVTTPAWCRLGTEFSGYLENSLKLFANQQQQMRKRVRDNTGSDPFAAFAGLTQQNLEFWRLMQDQFFNALSGTPPKPQNPPAANEPAEEPPLEDEEPKK